MRYILILSFALIFSSCAAHNTQRKIIVDTFYVPCDTMYYKKKADSLYAALMVEKYKVERVKYYLAIVDKKPSQLKFLRSWIRRAVY